MCAIELAPTMQLSHVSIGGVTSPVQAERCQLSSGLAGQSNLKMVAAPSERQLAALSHQHHQSIWGWKASPQHPSYTTTVRGSASDCQPPPNTPSYRGSRTIRVSLVTQVPARVVGMPRQCMASLRVGVCVHVCARVIV